VFIKKIKDKPGCQQSSVNFKSIYQDFNPPKIENRQLILIAWCYWFCNRSCI